MKYYHESIENSSNKQDKEREGKRARHDYVRKKDVNKKKGYLRKIDNKKLLLASKLPPSSSFPSPVFLEGSKREK